MTESEELWKVLVQRLEKECEYRSEYPGNIGPACLRCPACLKAIRESGVEVKHG